MDPNKTEISLLESLPQDLLGIIVSKIDRSDPEAYYNCITSCKELGANAYDKRVCASLSLTPLVKKPLASLNYPIVMNRCLANNNSDAHYIRGILNYFVLNNDTEGIEHLCIAADAGHKEAVYFYVMILLCTGMFEEGKNYLGKLKWMEEGVILDTCWNNIKGSLDGIDVRRKKGYFVSLRKMQPKCHFNDIESTCMECIYYKKMFKFIFMI